MSYGKNQLRSLSAVETLSTFTKNDADLPKLLNGYLIACKVEGKSPKTLEGYCQAISGFVLFVQGNNLPQKVSEISANDVRLFLLSLQERGLSPYSIRTYYRTLKTFFNWLESEGFIKESPMVRIRSPRLPRKIIRPFSREDIDNLLSVCSGNHFVEHRNRAIVLLFLDTGLRLAELASIQLADIDFDRETIRVMGKGAKERVVRIGKTTQRALLRYILLREDNHPCLWVTEERRPMTRRGIQIAIRRLCQRAGIVDAKCGPHTFRHTAAINYLRNGGDIFTLQNMLGHSTLEMTRRYTNSLGVEDMIRVHRKASPVDKWII